MASPQAKPSPRGPRNNRATTVHLRLRSKIVSGHFPQGSALAEPTLAEHFQTSRAPIREALIALEREGLVQFEKTGRTRVRSFSGAELKEIMEARAAIEGMAARLANRLWTKEDTVALEKNIAAQERARDLAELSRLDIDLHHHVVTRSGNASLVRLWEPCAGSGRCIWLKSIAARRATTSSRRRRPSARTSTCLRHWPKARPPKPRKP